jgi:thiol-disulfide isomerase/thioredoxin
MTSENRRSGRAGFPTWLLLLAVFVAAAVVTIVIGTRGSTTETTYPDLGQIAENDPNLPSTSEPAPTFALPALDGSTFDLARHLADDGRPIVLNLWASWCPPCRSEMPEIDASATQHPEVAFVGVAVQDDTAKATAFAEEIAIGYTIAFDDGSVEKAYPVLGLPATFFIDGDGILVKTHVGPVTVESLDEDIAALFES